MATAIGEQVWGGPQTVNVNFFLILRLAPEPLLRNRVSGFKAPTMRRLGRTGFIMSPILPISLLTTVLCIIGAVDGILFQQLLFVGAAVAATVLVCSFEAWNAREAPRQGEDEGGVHDLTDL